jgi:hypothetical protein
VTDEPDTSNINFTNSVLLNTGSGGSLNVGTEVSNPVRNVTMENLDNVGTLYFIWLGSEEGQLIEKVYLKNVRDEGTRESLIVLGGRPATGPIREVVLSNVTAAGWGGGRSTITGHPGSPVEGITFTNLRVGGELVRDLPGRELSIGSDVRDVSFTEEDSSVVGVTASKMDAVRGGEAGEFVLSRTGDLSVPLTVRYRVRGTARPGEDYEALPGEVTFAAGSGSAVVRVAAKAGSRTEPIKTVLLSLENEPLSAAWMLGPDYHAVVSIVCPEDHR